MEEQAGVGSRGRVLRRVFQIKRSGFVTDLPGPLRDSGHFFFWFSFFFSLEKGQETNISPSFLSWSIIARQYCVGFCHTPHRPVIIIHISHRYISPLKLPSSLQSHPLGRHRATGWAPSNFSYKIQLWDSQLQTDYRVEYGAYSYCIFY